jgi:hypothetical protein
MADENLHSDEHVPRGIVRHCRLGTVNVGWMYTPGVRGLGDWRSGVDLRDATQGVSEGPLYVEHRMGGLAMIVIGSVVVAFHYHTLPVQRCLISVS